jgi:cobalt-zinc-cadmium efflux system outer membrane protein
LAGTQYQPNFSYLHEREHKRELRLESAKEGTQIAGSQHEDLERNLLFGLRSMLCRLLRQRLSSILAKADLDYYDKIIDISRARFKPATSPRSIWTGSNLLRVQYEAEIETAIVNLRTAEDSTAAAAQRSHAGRPVRCGGDSSTGADALQPLEDYHQIALDNRPDLRAAIQTIQQSDTNHKLAVSNGSTDPTFGAWYTYNGSFNNPNSNQTLGLNVSIPLRIFDRNQGEKKRTLMDIDRSQERRRRGQGAGLRRRGLHL